MHSSSYKYSYDYTVSFTDLDDIRKLTTAHAQFTRGRQEVLITGPENQ